MTAATHDFVCEQGATFRKVLTYRVKSTQSPINLTGYTAFMQVRQSEDPDPLVDLSVGSGITLGGVAGTIEIVIDADTTQELDQGVYSYDLELQQGSEEYKILRGKFTVLRGYTQ